MSVSALSPSRTPCIMCIHSDPRACDYRRHHTVHQDYCRPTPPWYDSNLVLIALLFADHCTPNSQISFPAVCPPTERWTPPLDYRQSTSAHRQTRLSCATAFGASSAAIPVVRTRISPSPHLTRGQPFWCSFVCRFGLSDVLSRRKNASL